MSFAEDGDRLCTRYAEFVPGARSPSWIWDVMHTNKTWGSPLTGRRRIRAQADDQWVLHSSALRAFGRSLKADFQDDTAP